LYEIRSRLQPDPQVKTSKTDYQPNSLDIKKARLDTCIFRQNLTHNLTRE